MLEQPADAIYMRALMDRDAENDGELSFRKNDIVFVDDTLYGGGGGGMWRAWLLADDTTKVRCGTIPSKSRYGPHTAASRHHPRQVTVRRTLRPHGTIPGKSRYGAHCGLTAPSPASHGTAHTPRPHGTIPSKSRYGPHRGLTAPSPASHGTAHTPRPHGTIPGKSRYVGEV